MKQLSALDTTFLNLETDTTPMHVGCVAIYDPTTMPDGVFNFDTFLNNFEKKLARISILRQRHVNPPMGIDYPYWISDPDFTLNYHIRHISLPKPGDWGQLCTQVARIHAQPLDLQKPPWEIYILAGLNNIAGIPAGSFALVSKMHHALIDGVRGAQLLAALHDLTPTPSYSKKTEPVIVDRVPTAIELMTRAAINLPGSILSKARTTGRYALPLIKNVANKLLSNEKTLPQVPKTRFNKKVTSHRTFDAVSFDLKEIKQLRKLVPGSTINDIMVSIISGGMRRYLSSKSELPSQSMNAMIPINIASPAAGAVQGNHISFMFPSIHSDIADPVERLSAIHKENKVNKKKQASHKGQLIMDSTQLLPTTLTNIVVEKAIKYNFANKMQPLFNTVITNVPGPQMPLYHAGAKMLAFHGAGNLLRHSGFIPYYFQLQRQNKHQHYILYGNDP